MRGIPDECVAEWRKLGVYPDETLSAAFARSSTSAPEQRLVLWSERQTTEISLSRLYELAGRAAAGLTALGLGPGDAVVAQLPNWLETAVLHAALARIGAVLIPLVPDFGPRQLRFVFQQARVAMLVTPGIWRDRDYAMQASEALPETTVRSHIVVGETAAIGTLSWASLLTDSRLPPVDRYGSPDDLAAIIYTSGTVAQPKGVRHSHRSLLAELSSDPDNKTRLSPWPQGHIAGYLNLLRFWAGGRKTVLMDRWNPEKAAQLIADHKVETSTGSPTHLSSLLDVISARGAKDSSLHSYLAGGTSIPPSLVEKCAALGIRTYRCYGLSEHPTVSRGNPDEPLEVRLATDGMPCTGTQVRIVGDDHRDVEPGLTGEIAVRGPETFLGYVDPLLDRDCFLDGGWFLTGDIGRIRDDGRLIVTDRKKDVIIRGGETLSSREIEEALLQLPGIAEAAVVGSPDERLGERICAFICGAPEFDFSAAQISSQFADAGVSRHKVPELILLVDHLPKTVTGKVSKQELRQRIRQWEVGPDVARPT